MIRFLAFSATILLLISCKAKKKNPEVPADQFFPVTTYLKGELARIDTSLSSFFKIETVDGKSDTVPIKNSDVRKYAADFASLPDISSDDLRGDYEMTKEYDDILHAYVFVFTTKEDLPVRREDIVLDLEPNEKGENNIRSLFVELWENEGDSAVRKNMLWEAGKNFRITTVTEKDGTQKTKKLQVLWNGFDGQNQ